VENEICSFGFLVASIRRITLTAFMRGRIIEFRNALLRKAITVFIFGDDNATLAFFLATIATLMS